MTLGVAQLWRHIMAGIAVIVVSCMLLTSLAHAAEPVFDIHVAEHSMGDPDHSDSGPDGEPEHGCVAHCHGHNYAHPPIANALGAPMIVNAGWAPSSSRSLAAALVLGLERPPRV
jgi:hypothetical protein